MHISEQLGTFGHEHLQLHKSEQVRHLQLQLHKSEHDGHFGQEQLQLQSQMHSSEHVGHFGHEQLHLQLQQSKQGRDLKLQQLPHVLQFPRHGFSGQMQEQGLLHQQLHFGNEHWIHEQQSLKPHEQHWGGLRFRVQSEHPVQQHSHDRLKHDDPLFIDDTVVSSK